ncbi:unnamed protein product [Orchesella dallaii]|uniref:DUF5641 domain-containing protein n=1 Tax=Orchesella dallaii TaxID=48710 RepID=A0ABP1QN19_9HEXA
MKDATEVKMIKWKFIPPASPHMRGSWERFLGSTKKVLDAIQKEQRPNDGTLRTLFSGCVSGSTIPGNFLDDDKYRKSWRYAQHLADQFWMRWSMEYLPLLAKRQKWLLSGKPLKIGDPVLNVDYQAPRNQWKRAVITLTYPGRDGRKGVVEVKTPSVDPLDVKKKVKVTIMKRPVVKVCPLSFGEGKSVALERENVAEGTIE